MGRNRKTELEKSGATVMPNCLGVMYFGSAAQEVRKAAWEQSKNGDDWLLNKITEIENG